MRGILPEEYVLDPKKWSPSDAYVQMNRFTYEEFLPDELKFVVMLLPPLRFEGVTLKGLFCTPGVDAVRQLVASSVWDNFISIANSRWASYPWSVHAEGYFVLYNNTARMNHFRETYPARGQVRLIPRQTADNTDERRFSPRPNVEKDIDILIASRLHIMKHLPFLAKGLVALRRRDPARRYRVVWAGAGSQANDRHSRSFRIVQDMEATLGRLDDYIESIGRIAPLDMPALYARAKSFVLTSTVEGKNRAISEAMLCDVPVVVTDDFNEAARGGQPILPPGAGLTVPRDPDGLAEGLARAVQNYGDFKPRTEYLKVSGQMNFFWDCLLGFEHFSEGIPGQTREERERWLDAAIAANYGISSLRRFLFYSHPESPLAAANGLRSLNYARGKVETTKLFEVLSTE